MTITADRTTPYREGELYSYPMAAATHLYAGQMIVLNNLGNAEAATAAAAKTVVGCSQEDINNTAAAAAKNVTVRSGVHKWVNSAVSAVTKANIGSVVYIEDDITIKRVAGGHSAAGIMVDLDADGGVWVDSNVSKILASVGLTAANNLSDVANAATSRANLALDTGDSPTFVGLTLTGALSVATTSLLTGAVNMSGACTIAGILTNLCNYAVKVADYSVVTATDANGVFQTATDNVVFKLPNIAAANKGVKLTFQNTAAAGNAKVSISPDASDKIAGTVGVITSGAVADKDWINTKATCVQGDYTTIISDGTDTWWIIGGQGVWASE